MKFINVDELKIRKFQSIIDDISTEDNNILNELELMAIDEITSYLHNRYDTEMIFSRIGINRNNLIKRITIDFIICYLFERVNSNEIPEYVSLRCEKNIEWLKDVAKGIISPDLPMRDPILENNTYFKYGSEIKFNNVDNLY